MNSMSYVNTSKGKQKSGVPKRPCEMEEEVPIECLCSEDAAVFCGIATRDGTEVIEGKQSVRDRVDVYERVAACFCFE